MNWITTNLRLPEDLYMELKLKAARERKSVAAVIRERLTDKKSSGESYRKSLLSIKGVWDLEPEIKRNRAQVEKRLKRLWNE